MTDAESIDRYLDATGPTVPAFSADPADRTADRTATVSGHGRRYASVSELLSSFLRARMDR